ncbi:hypothetical protein IKB17_03755 [bacterium]|nr:hypothetical protein [bacterium]
MQENSKILYEAISRVIHKTRIAKSIKYTDFCYENDIPMSTYDAIINASAQSSYYNISKVIKALGLSFTEFGALLDKELPPEYWNNES